MLCSKVEPFVNQPLAAATAAAHDDVSSVHGTISPTGGDQILADAVDAARAVDRSSQVAAGDTAWRRPLSASTADDEGSVEASSSERDRQEPTGEAFLSHTLHDCDEAGLT